MSPLVIYENAGRYSAASSAGVLFYNLSYEAAAVALMDAGFPIGLLESPVDGLTWRSTLTSAFANEIASLNDAIADLAPWQDVAAIQDKQAALQGQLNDLQRAVRQADIRTEIARCEQILWQQELPQLMQALGPRSSEYECVMALKRTSPTAKRIEALHAEWSSLQ